MSQKKDRNLTVKILALFISILLWSYVRSEVNPNIIREFRGIDVEVINERVLNEKGLVVIEPKNIKISVKISGRRNDVNSIELKDIEAQVDLLEATRGTQKIPIEVNVPFRVELENISSRYVTFEIDSLVTVEKEVNLNFLGANKEYSVNKSEVTPKTIKISGPSSLTNKISKVIVDVNVDKITSDDIIKLPIKIVDDKLKEIKGLKTNIDMVNVSISLLNSKQVPIKPRVIGILDEEYTLNNINVSPNTVTIRGLEEDLKDINEIETEEINLGDIKEDKNLNVNLKVPERVIIDGDKKTANIKITLKKQNQDLEEVSEIEKELTLTIEDVKPENLKEGLKISFEDETNKSIDIKLRGDKGILENLNKEGINLSIDLNNLEEGTHELEIKASTIDNLDIVNISPNLVKVKIETV